MIVPTIGQSIKVICSQLLCQTGSTFADPTSSVTGCSYMPLLFQWSTDDCVSRSDDRRLGDFGPDGPRSSRCRDRKEGFHTCAGTEVLGPHQQHGGMISVSLLYDCLSVSHFTVDRYLGIPVYSNHAIDMFHICVTYFRTCNRIIYISLHFHLLRSVKQSFQMHRR